MRLRSDNPHFGAFGFLPTAGAVLLTFCIGQALCGEREPLRSGRQVGETVPSFYVRDVTCRQPDLARCYVCRHGDRPVVMVFARSVNDSLARLLREVTAMVDEHRGEGARGFAVFLDYDDKHLAGKLLDLAKQEKVTIPLCIGSRHVESSTSQRIHPQADVTVVMYVKQKVVSNFAFRDGQLAEKDRRDVLARLREMFQQGQ